MAFAPLPSDQPPTQSLPDQSEAERVLLIRLPCNPIFPIGPIYLADHLHKCFPSLPQRILDLAALPVLDVERVLQTVVDQFRPTLLVFSWRDIQIYAPVDGRGGNPLQNSFEVFYASNPLKRLRGALGGLRPVSYTHLTLPTNREV